MSIVTATDLKNYVYCPMTIYYRNVLCLEERVTEAMTEGAQVDRDEILNFLHLTLKPLEVVRKPYLISRRFLVSGVPDFVLKLRRSWSPLDVKDSYGERRDHRAQVLLYSFLLEESGKSVKQGLIYYVRGKKLFKMPYGEEERREVLLLLTGLRRVLKGELPRVRQPVRKCINCGFFNYCKPKLEGVAYVR